MCCLLCCDVLFLLGRYDGAEVCEIVGSYILYLLSNILDKDLVGLYRDDGLAIVRNLSSPEIESKTEAINELFKECGLHITIQIDLKIFNFLDVEMNLDSGTYRPYRKPDNMPAYINRIILPTVFKELSEAIAKRISDISFYEVVFNESIPICSDALRKSGFHNNTTFIPKNHNIKTNKKKTRKRKIIWFNPPNAEYGCNCRSKESCPLQNQCLTQEIVYPADVKNLTNDGKTFYFRVTEASFKERFGNNTRVFKHLKYRNSTELSKYIWELKDANISPVTE